MSSADGGTLHFSGIGFELFGDFFLYNKGFIVLAPVIPSL